MMAVLLQQPTNQSVGYPPLFLISPLFTDEKRKTMAHVGSLLDSMHARHTVCSDTAKKKKWKRQQEKAYLYTHIQTDIDGVYARTHTQYKKNHSIHDLFVYTYIARK